MDYQTLMGQAQALIAQANAMRQAEKDAAIIEIRQVMANLRITVEDLGSTEKRKPAAKPLHPPKYRGPQGQLWAGVKGPRPRWVQQVLEAGGSLDDYLISKATGDAVAQSATA